MMDSRGWPYDSFDCLSYHKSQTVRAHVSHFFLLLFSDKVVKFIGGGSVINGATPSSSKYTSGIIIANCVFYYDSPLLFCICSAFLTFLHFKYVPKEKKKLWDCSNSALLFHLENYC